MIGMKSILFLKKSINITKSPTHADVKVPITFCYVILYMGKDYWGYVVSGV